MPPRRGAYYLDDGPSDGPPPDHDRIPDAEPRMEPLHRFANNPYVVFGKAYVPERTLRPFRERGTASWYGRRFHGQTTSTGEPYDMFAMTGAHPTLPLPSYARVTNLTNGRTVVIRLNDRGPFHRGRIIDLSYTAAAKLGYLEQGSAVVEVEAIVPGMPMAAASRLVPEDRGGPARVTAGGTEASATGGKLYVQLAALSLRASAERLRAQLSLELAELDRAIEIFLQDGLYRLHIGPYRSRAEAVAVADRLKRLLDHVPHVVVR
jgi:rare lipoprotein A